MDLYIIHGPCLHQFWLTFSIRSVGSPETVDFLTMFEIEGITTATETYHPPWN